MIKFSVLITIYFREKAKFFAECLDSLVNQTVQANEIVLVLDGPLNTNLYNLIEEYKVKLPLKVIALPENIGSGKASNEGLKHCSYDWVFRMDSDDICVPNRFEKQLEYIQNNPDVILLGGQILEYSEDMSREIGIRKVPVIDEEIRQYALFRHPFNNMTVGYKKEIVLAAGGYKHHLYMEDYNLHLRVLALSQVGKVANLSNVLVYARTNIASYERRKGLEYIKSEFLLAKLKSDLKMQTSFISYIYGLLRIIPRLLPSQLLGKFYRFLRKSH